MKIAIVGSGVAAYEAAVAARAGAPDAQVVIHSRESVLPYRRPALSRSVATEVPDAQFFIKPAAFYADNRIEVRLNQTLTALDPVRKILTFADSAEERFDRLLLATGSRCFLPPIPGIDSPNVLSLREYADLTEIRRRLAGGARRFVVIGGGLLGLELAESLIARGGEVTVIEACPALLPRNLDHEGAERAFRQLREVPRLSLRFGVGVKAVTPDGVTLDEEFIAADLVFVSAGTRANTQIAVAAGLACNRGISVGTDLQCSVPDIWAAGDCAEVDHASYGLYAAAQAMGRVAGRRMSNDNEARFVPAIYPARLSVFGLKLFSAGRLEGVRSEGSGEGCNYQRLFYDDAGQLTGCVLMGDLRNAPKLQLALEKQP